MEPSYPASGIWGTNNRQYSTTQPQRTGGYRFAPNAQMTSAQSIFANTNLNTVFGSSSDPPLFTSGNQFNFPLRSTRSSNLGISPTQQCGGGSGYHNITRANGKPRKPLNKGQSNSHRTVDVEVLSSSLGRTSLDENDENLSRSPAPQYRIFKRGDEAMVGNSTADSNTQNPPTGLTIQEPRRINNGDEKKNDTENQGDARGISIGTLSQSTLSNSQQLSNSPTPIGLIAELAKYHSLSAEYHLVKETGPPHAPIFTISLHLGTEKHEANGPSIKKAQLAAATLATEKTVLAKPPPRNYTNKRNSLPWRGHNMGQNKSLLQLLALSEEMKQPLAFVNHPVTTVNPFLKVTPLSCVAVHIGDRIFTGEGNSFNSAKSMAVMVALKALLRVKKEQEISRLGASGETPPEEVGTDDSKSPISIVYEMALKRNLPISYHILKEDGPAHMKVFTIQCKVGEELTTESEGFTKQQAKKLASEQMMTKLKDIPLPHFNSENSFRAIQRGFIKPKVTKKKPGTGVVKDIDKSAVSPISRLIQIAHLRKYKEPEFSVVSATSGSEEPQSESIQPQKPNKRNSKLRRPHFVIEVKFGPHVCKGEGPNKKSAKKSAADNALVMLGYPPSESKAESPKSESTNQGQNTEEPSSSTKSPKVFKIISGRQLVPGILALNNQCSGPTGEIVQNESALQQKMAVKTEIGKQFPSTVPSVAHEAVNKLSYLAQLLGVQVSYSDFPKKNEYLCVVSLCTIPPHVSHGIGASLEAARNNAALQVLAELSDRGLENEQKSPDKPKGKPEVKIEAN